MPSEKVKVLSLRHSKMFSQGKRNDNIYELQQLENPQLVKQNETLPLIGARLKSDEKLGIEYGLSNNTVARLLRIDHLIVELKQHVDNGKIVIYPAVSLSYLSETIYIEETIANNEYKFRYEKN